jgi:Fe-Mn family superoxide dismutase
MKTSRRKFIRNSSLLAIAGVGAQFFSSPLVKAAGKNLFSGEPFTLPALPYGYDALEPHIDKMTMEIHHDKHHAGYVANLNKAVLELDKGVPALDVLVRNASKYATAIRNNGGGHWNHSFFWKLMKPGGGGTPSGKIAAAIDGAFGSFDGFKKQLEEAAAKRFGSGWAWLVVGEDKKLAIGSTPNQDNPMMDLSDFKGTPVLGLDVWEHAYYLKYQNRRADYVKAWWNLLNWEEVNMNLELAEKG